MYTTPIQEANTQLYQEGIAGVYSVKLEFNYKSQVKVNVSWGEKNPSIIFHDFQHHKDGCIRIWKSYEIGSVKVFTPHYL